MADDDKNRKIKALALDPIKIDLPEDTPDIPKNSDTQLAAHPPEKDEPDEKAPEAQPAAPRGPSLVQQYIRNKLASQNDPELERLQKQAQFNQAMSDMGNHLGAVGRNLTNLTASFAGAKPIVPEPQDSTEANQAPVKTYIQRKLQAQQSAKEDAEGLKNAAEAEKAVAQADNLGDPNGTKQQELALKRQGIAARLAELQDRIKRGDNADEARREMIALHKQDQAIRQITADNAQKSLGMRQQGLDLRAENMGNREGQGIVPNAESQDRYLTPGDATKANNMIGSAGALKKMTQQLRDLETQSRLGMLAPSEAKGQAQALIGELPFYINAAQSERVLSGPRAKAVHDAFADPRKASSMIDDLFSGGGYTKSNLNQLDSMVDDSLRNQMESKGVHLGADYSKANPHPVVRAAKPGRPGAQAPLAPGQKRGMDGKIYERNPETGKWRPADG